MADRIPTESSPSVASLLGGIVSDLQTLIRQEMALAKSEMIREWDKAKTAAGSMASGAAVLALGGFFLCVTIACVLTEVVGLPWWGSFLIVGGVLTGAGAVLFLFGRSRAAEVHVVPPQTVETLKEDVQWMRNQT
jgi:uncharacterized membrane protein YdjX (TVP38/TMEM64 family)